jgi:hypothetical protein
MARRFLTAEEVRQGISTEKPVFLIFPFGDVYRGFVVKETPLIKMPDGERVATFDFHGDHTEKQGVGGSFPVIPGQLFVEDGE